MSRKAEVEARLEELDNSIRNVNDRITGIKLNQHLPNGRRGYLIKYYLEIEAQLVKEECKLLDELDVITANDNSVYKC